MTTVQIDRIWRVGYRADPLHVLTAKQGDGRFDDGEHLIGVVYAAEQLETCLRELLRPWPPSPDAAPMLYDIEAPEDEEDRKDAAVDMAVADFLTKSARVPAKIYERDAVLAVTGTPPIELLDLRDFKTRLEIDADPEIKRQMLHHGFKQFDVGALTSRDEFRPVTQAVTNAVVRGSFRSEAVQGLASISRHDLQPIYAIFQDGRYDDTLRMNWKFAEGGPLTPANPTLGLVAKELGLTP